MREKVLLLLANADGFISGQEICEQLNVSRTAVWKAVQQLKEEGFEIEAVRNRGYRLVSIPDVLSAEAVQASLKTRWAGRKILFYPETASTNNTAKRIAEEGAPHGTLVLADCQTAGKGRRGRGFSSPAGTGIYMSLILKEDMDPANAPMLTIVMGLSVARAIEETTFLKPLIKWPNDIILSRKKVCGILTEMSLQVDAVNNIVIGAGINVQNKSFPEELRSIATSLYIESGRVTNRVTLTAEILKQFEWYYEIFMRTQNLSGLLNDYNARLINRGRVVRVLDEKNPCIGTALGMDETGRLLVDTEYGLRRILSGEVSVRGVYGYV